MDVNFEQKLHTGKSLMRNFGAAATLVLHGFFWRGIAHRFRLLSQDSYSRKNAEFHAKVCGIRNTFLRESLRKKDKRFMLVSKILSPTCTPWST